MATTSTEITQDMIKAMVHGMLSHDRNEIRATCLRYFHPDIVLYHHLTRTKNREELYRVYRTYSKNCDSQPVFREILIDGDRAMVWVDQHVTARALPVPWARIVVPTLVFLRFTRMPDGRMVAIEQVDHISSLTAAWSFPLSHFLLERVWQPVGQWCFDWSAWLFDFWDDTKVFIHDQFLEGWCCKQKAA